MTEHLHEYDVIGKVGSNTWRLLCSICKDVFDLQLTNPNAGATPARTTGAHSGGNRGVRCAGEAIDIDRDGAGLSSVAVNGRSIGTSSAGGNSDPGNLGKTSDSAQGAHLAANISAPSPYESKRKSLGKKEESR